MGNLLSTSWARGPENPVALTACPGEPRSAFSPLRLAFLILVGTESVAGSLPGQASCEGREKENDESEIEPALFGAVGSNPDGVQSHLPVFSAPRHCSRGEPMAVRLC